MAPNVTLMRALSDGKRRSLAEAMRFAGADEYWLATHYMETTEKLAHAGKPTKLLMEMLRECAKNLEGNTQGGKNGQGIFEIVHCVSRPERFDEAAQGMPECDGARGATNFWHGGEHG